MGEMFGIGKDTGIRDAVGIAFTVAAALLLFGVATRLPAADLGVDSAWANEVREIQADADAGSCTPQDSKTPTTANAPVRTEARI